MTHDGAAIRVQNLVKSFGGRRVIDDISFSVRRGEVLVVMGGSGCGKSTLLRHLIGVLKPDSGEIWIEGEEITRMNRDALAGVRRKFGMLFQSGGLLNSMTVGENVALPIREHSRVDNKIADLMVKMKLELVGLTGFENLRPSEISGGMKKRVGLARAIALDPTILFSDEPTSGLDPVMTAVVDTLTLDLVHKLGMTAVVVTHDMTSAFRIASKMIMLFQGKIIAQGTPDEIRASDDPVLKQFVDGQADGPIPLRLSKGDYLKHLIG